jgi:hypothetical protein
MLSLLIDDRSLVFLVSLAFNVDPFSLRLHHLDLVLIYTEAPSLLVSLLFPPLLLYLVVHGLVLIIEVGGEPGSWDVFDLVFEDLGDGESLLLEDEQKEHQLVLSLLAIV